MQRRKKVEQDSNGHNTGTSRVTANLLSHFMSGPSILVLSIFFLLYTRRLYSSSSAELTLTHATVSKVIYSKFGWPLLGLPSLRANLYNVMSFPNLCHLKFTYFFFQDDIYLKQTNKPLNDNRQAATQGKVRSY